MQVPGSGTTRSYPITSIKRMSTAVISFFTPLELNALKASLAPLCQSRESPPPTWLNCFNKVVPLLIEKKSFSTNP